jgi:ribosomal-protein-alanine N-acetyltransferase
LSLPTTLVRHLVQHDLPQVLEIECATHTRPWDEAAFRFWQRQRSCILMVAEQGDTIVGYLVYELDDQCLRLHNFAVHPGYQRQGIGRELTQALQRAMTSHRRGRMEVVIHERNLTAHLFLRAMGFRAEAVLYGHDEDTGESGYRFAYTVPVTTAGQVTPVPL